MRIALALLTVVTLPAVIAGQPPVAAQKGERPRFDAASVKPNGSPQAGINNQFSPGRFVYVNTPLEVFIYNAYRFPSDRVVGIPDWARREKYDITATHSPEYAAFSQEQLGMLQRLLEERFALQTHRETRDMPVFELVRIRTDGLGPRLRPADPACAPGGTADRAQCGTRINPGVIDGRFVNWRMVVDQLPGATGRAVIDNTGLTGMFEVRLEWNPDPAVTKSPEAAAAATAAAATPGERVTIFTALQEQLGVRLQAARAPLEVLVIDRLERPTPD
jgi:uncharacterized protein (TIGR03435 family)